MKAAVIGNGNVGMAAFGELLRMPEIREKGIERCCRELLDSIRTPYIHLSFDVDFMDSGEYTATGLPIPDGPSVEQTHQTLRTLFADPRVCSVDFVEYSPLHDQNEQGLNVCMGLMHTPTSIPTRPRSPIISMGCRWQQHWGWGTAVCMSP